MPDTVLLVGDSASNPNLYYKTHFLAGDPFVYLERDGEATLVVSSMEHGRASKESSVQTVRRFEDYGYRDLVRETGDRAQAFAGMLVRIVEQAGTNRVTVEPVFPVHYADLLREHGIQIDVDPDLLIAERRRKSTAEIEAIAAAQAAAERATQLAIDMIRSSDIRDGVLYYEGEQLTAERLRASVEIALLGENMETTHGSIIAPGPGAADPHWEGSGPIRAGQAVVMDIFPRGRRSRYFGDMTRTVVKGKPDDVLQAMYDAVLRAQEAALSQIRAGANGKDVHEAVERIFAETGFTGDGSGPRYIHGTGHGVGLEIHEGPGLSSTDQQLCEGDVVTVEPGLYDPQIGGVRIEDTVVVTQDGYRNLNSLPKQFVV